MTDICVVIVTYNRLEKLKTALSCYDRQTVQPRYILVVDNNSTDGTGEYLRKWETTKNCETDEKGPVTGRNPLQNGEVRHIVLNLRENTGGSGGFYEGLKSAMELDCTWIWAADDDAYPSPDCFDRLIRYESEHTSENISAVCAAVEVCGETDTWHRRRLTKRFGICFEQRIDKSEYNHPFKLDLFSYVGVMIKKDAMKETGLPEKDFFISYDDSEHSLRVRKTGSIVCVPEATVNHDTKDTGPDGGITWKRYYNIRNKIYSYKKNLGALQAFIQSVHYRLKYRHDKVAGEMTKQAIKDACHGKLGRHEIYGPGWKPQI